MLRVALTSVRTQDWQWNAQDQKKSNELHPSWSPNGLQLTFFSDVDGNDEIYTLTLKTQQRQRLTFDGAEDSDPTWSPSGDYIAFHSNRGGNFDIYIVRPDGTGLERIISEQADEMSPSWSRDGKLLSIEIKRDDGWQVDLIDIESRKRSNYNTYVYHLDTKEIRQLLTSESTPVEATWNRDRTALIYLTRDAGQFDVKYWDAKTGESIRLTDNIYKESAPKWLNKEEIVFSMNPNDLNIWRLKLDYCLVKSCGYQKREYATHFTK